jgi:hypothetical protein
MVLSNGKIKNRYFVCNAFNHALKKAPKEAVCF